MKVSKENLHTHTSTYAEQAATNYTFIDRSFQFLRAINKTCLWRCNLRTTNDERHRSARLENRDERTLRNQCARVDLAPLAVRNVPIAIESFFFRVLEASEHHLLALLPIVDAQHLITQLHHQK